VWVQPFCLTPGKQRWFIVSFEKRQTTADAAPIPNDVLAQKEAILLDFGEVRAERKLQLDVRDAEIAHTDQTGWWKRTDRVKHLGKSNLKHLTHVARLPGKDEPELKVVADSVDDLIEDCVKGLASLPREIRRWLKSAKMEEVDQHPMGRLQNQNSQDRYANYWKRLICYSLRVIHSEQSHEAESPSLLEDVEGYQEHDDGHDGRHDDEEEDQACQCYAYPIRVCTLCIPHNETAVP
jgi:hypothetical protein